MCVVALSFGDHPRWRLALAGNRDEFHARPSTAIQRQNGLLGGRDLVSGGMWLGVSESGRCAVVTNVSGALPDPAKASRGALVMDFLESGVLPSAPDAYNGFNLIAVEADGTARRLSNRPAAQRQSLDAGTHSLSNGMGDSPWPRRNQLETAFTNWLGTSGEDVSPLFDMLASESPLSTQETPHPPIFIRGEDYGTRASTILLVDWQGQGRLIERSFGPGGVSMGQVDLALNLPPLPPPRTAIAMPIA
jgi:uncharacterized protein with NRDE domain